MRPPGTSTILEKRQQLNEDTTEAAVSNEFSIMNEANERPHNDFSENIFEGVRGKQGAQRDRQKNTKRN